jgi:hypothetical protein
MSAPIHVRRTAGERRAIATNSSHRQKDTGFHAMKYRTFGGDALEMIMRDVLEGLQDCTREASLASKKDDIENGDRKKETSARIIHFPRRYPTS